MKVSRTIIALSGSILLISVLSACGTKQVATPTASPTASPTLSTKMTILPCLASQLTWKAGQEGGAMGHIGVTQAGFVNSSATTCFLNGYPKFQMLDASGKAIPTFTLHGPSVSVPQITQTKVILAPGKEAFVDLGFANGTGYGNSQCPTSSFVEVTPPAATSSIKVAWKIQPFGGGTIQKLRCGEIYTSPVYHLAKY